MVAPVVIRRGMTVGSALIQLAARAPTPVARGGAQRRDYGDIADAQRRRQRQHRQPAATRQCQRRRAAATSRMATLRDLQRRQQQQHRDRQRRERERQQQQKHCVRPAKRRQRRRLEQYRARQRRDRHAATAALTWRLGDTAHPATGNTITSPSERCSAAPMTARPGSNRGGSDGHQQRRVRHRHATASARLQRGCTGNNASATNSTSSALRQQQRREPASSSSAYGASTIASGIVWLGDSGVRQQGARHAATCDLQRSATTAQRQQQRGLWRRQPGDRR